MPWWLFTRRRRSSQVIDAGIPSRLDDLEQAVARLERFQAARQAWRAALAGHRKNQPGSKTPPRHARPGKKPRFRLIRGRRLAIPLAAGMAVEVARRLRAGQVAWAGAAVSTTAVAVTGTVFAFHHPQPPAGSTPGAGTARPAASPPGGRRHPEGSPAPRHPGRPLPWLTPVPGPRYSLMGSGSPHPTASGRGSPGPSPSPTALPSPTAAPSPSPSPSPRISICIGAAGIHLCLPHHRHHAL